MDQQSGWIYICIQMKCPAVTRATGNETDLTTGHSVYTLPELPTRNFSTQRVVRTDKSSEGEFEAELIYPVDL